jgi:hypothetical protein
LLGLAFSFVHPFFIYRFIAPLVFGFTPYPYNNNGYYNDKGG